MEQQTKHRKFMRLAIRKAREGIENRQTPFGCCIVRNGEVVSCEHNAVWESVDITAHAEVIAIRKACRELRRVDLSGCVLYSTCEPCPMCFSAIHWARIPAIYFGASIGDAEVNGFNEINITNHRMKEMGNMSVEIGDGLLREECRALFGEWKTLEESRAY